MNAVKKALAGLMLMGAVATPLAVGSPASATSACDTSTRAGSPVIGAYVTASNGQAARSSCATVVRPQRYSASQVTFAGWIKDAATDARNATLVARFRVNGQWGSERIIVNTGNESWQTWSYAVNAGGTLDMMEIRACGWTAANGLVACGDKTVVYNF